MKYLNQNNENNGRQRRRAAARHMKAARGQCEEINEI
jgi:hypothetical protein